ncbi:Lipoprotein [Caenorhabditis elegans]|uniref:Lipoprotein n=1 Tax=Caenorhabditis elegans TaxID=6239 RepID=A0A6V7QYR7_CAEEL|nr:Lipoprotein [Caenorhabditis elegans]CAD1857017.1 Lipoprotein [Caenorhabditis elegans]
MIANLLFFVLKSSFLILNATFVSVILVGCSSLIKKKRDPPSTTKDETVTTQKPLIQNSTHSTDKGSEPSVHPAPTPVAIQTVVTPKSTTVSNTTSTPSQPTSKPKTPVAGSHAKSPMFEKTQKKTSNESLKPPPRTLRGAVPINTKSREAQKTMNDVVEVSAKNVAPPRKEKSSMSQDFDDYLNNLGENKN